MITRLAIAFFLLMGLGACNRHGEATVEKKPPVKVEQTAEKFSRLTLTADAAKRLDLQTRPVAQRDVDGTALLVIPYAAVLYDTDGATWIYTNPTTLTYVRTPITVANISGEDAFLSVGPPVGTVVVTTGAEELLGSETEFKEE